MRSFIMVLFLALSVQARAVTPTDILDHSPATDHLARLLSLGLNINTDYQIGGEWGKKPVTDADLVSNVVFRRMAMATANIRSGGTGFYIGEFNGRHVMASNHHVCPNAFACSGQNAVKFPLLKFITHQVEFYGTWPEIDLSLFSIEVNDAQIAEALKAVASPFAFEKNVYFGEPLVTIGFGIAENPGHQLMANRDSDCKVYSNNAEYRLMADPDDLNPADYKAWSFANGCDVSHGDSGSAMMDRETGDVVGIIWTGKIPKSPKVQTAEFMENLYKNPNEDVWKELSLSVPAVRMKIFLKNELDKNGIPSEFVPTVKSIINVQ